MNELTRGMALRLLARESGFSLNNTETDEEFNRKWAEHKNEFARLEAIQEQAAFEAKMEAETRMAEEAEKKVDGPAPAGVSSPGSWGNGKAWGAKVADPAKFILAGHAIFTVQNTQTGNRFTFKVSKHDKEENFWWVGVLTGPTNTSDYTCVGRIVSAKYIHNRSSKISEDAQSNKVFSWFWIHLHNLPDFIEVWHCGYCCVCGRLLTTPDSIQAGIGPVCAGR